MVKKSNNIRGFTLVELLIVVAIIGILAAVAYPAYTEQVRTSRRADAQGVMMTAAQAMERFFTENGTYVGAVAGTTFPAQSPIESATKYYNLSLNPAPTATTFTILATPIGAQVGDRRGNRTVTNTGARTGAQANCWR